MGIMKSVLFLALYVTLASGQGLSHGSLCETDADCNVSAHLRCIAKNCECDPRQYIVNPQKVCKKTYNQPCEHILDCNIDKYLTCGTTSKLCECQQPNTQIFDGGMRKACVSKIGSYCAHMADEFSLNCVRGAYCDMPIVNGSMIHSCECNEGWEPTSELTCRRTSQLSH